MRERAADSTVPETPPADEIVTTRFLPVLRPAMFAAFRDPVRLAAWWGPAGFTNSFHEFDFRSGGVWRFTMQGPDGTAYAMNKRFVEIVEPERIVVRHAQQGHDFRLTMTFAVQGEGTELTWRMSFDDPDEAQKLRPFLLQANEENFDRLAAHLSAAGGSAR